MNINVNLSKQWHKSPNNDHIHILGFITNINDYKSILKSANTIEEWSNALESLNGFFSIVKQSGYTIFAAVDHIRSRPLFYSQNANNFYLSDNAEWIRQQISSSSIDDYSKAEFQLVGYVTGQSTLYKEIKQLQAGECLVLSKNKISIKRYYLFIHKENSFLDSHLLKVNLDKVAKESIQRTIDYANGRQIVIPLSGGYDSRLIATLLKLKNYKNIITFTYGDKESLEAKQSKAVAESLGLKWYFIEYTTALWKETWASNDRVQYQVQSSNWCSLPHMQDWLAIKQMTDKGLIEKDAIFVPGHSGDFTAGSHIPKFIFDSPSKKFTINDVANRIYDKHYCLSPVKRTNINKKQFIFNILKNISDCTVNNNKDFANAYEKWIWQERQAKFICNSIYVYDFFGYDWWLPLWDKDYVNFFASLPLSLRNHSWYTEYVTEVYLESIISPNKLDVLDIEPSSMINKIAQTKLLRNQVSIYNALSKIYRKYFKKNHLSLLVGDVAHDEKIQKTLQKEGYTSNGRNAFFFLREFIN